VKIKDHFVKKEAKMNAEFRQNYDSINTHLTDRSSFALGTGLAAQKMLDLPRIFPETCPIDNFCGYYLRVFDTSAEIKNIELIYTQVPSWNNPHVPDGYFLLARRISDFYRKMNFNFGPVSAFGGGFFGLPNRNNSTLQRHLIGYSIAAYDHNISTDDWLFVDKLVKLVNAALAEKR
jgi:hypothetical protein